MAGMMGSDMSDTVDKGDAWDAAVAIPRKAQAEITRLQAEIDRLKEALQPFADSADGWDEYQEFEALVEGWNGSNELQTKLTVSDLRNAREALKQ